MFHSVQRLVALLHLKMCTAQSTAKDDFEHGSAGGKEADMDPVEEIWKKIEDLKKRWPAHTVPRALVMELDELEAALDAALKERREGKPDAETDGGG